MYEILQHTDIGQLEKLVIDHIKGGWFPAGGVCAAVNAGGPGRIVFYQAMHLPSDDSMVFTVTGEPEFTTDEDGAALKLADSYGLDATDGALRLADEYSIDLTKYYQGERLTYHDVKAIIAEGEHAD